MICSGSVLAAALRSCIVTSQKLERDGSSVSIISVIHQLVMNLFVARF